MNEDTNPYNLYDEDDSSCTINEYYGGRKHQMPEQKAPKIIQAIPAVPTTHHGKAIVKMEKLTEEYNQLLIKLVSVTDIVLKEQLKEEHDILEKSLVDAIAECTHAKLLDLVDEHTAKYKSMVMDASLLDSLVYSDTKKKVVIDTGNMRLRMPESLLDRRILCVLCDALSYTIHIHDLEGYVVDTIGKGSIDLSIYIDLLTRFDEYDSATKYTTVVMKSN